MLFIYFICHIHFCVIDTLFLVLVYLSYTFLFHILYLFIYFSYTVLCTFHILSYTVLCHFHILVHILFMYCTLYFPYTVIYSSLSFSYTCSYIFHVLYFVLFIYDIFHIPSSCTLLLILVTVYYHCIAVLCFSYHVIHYMHFICIYLSFSFRFHVCKYLRRGYGK